MALSEEEDISSLKLRAKAAFSLVELQTKETRGKCDEREIPMLCRTLGLNPTQEQLLAIVEELRGVGPDGAANATGYVAYQRFEDVMLDLLTARRTTSRPSRARFAPSTRTGTDSSRRST